MWMCDMMVSVSPCKESVLCCYEGLYSRRLHEPDPPHPSAGRLLAGVRRHTGDDGGCPPFTILTYLPRAPPERAPGSLSPGLSLVALFASGSVTHPPASTAVP